MSGSIGGKRIKREEVQPTLDRYIAQVLSKMPGFVSAQITGSYNAGTRKDHGDIDLAVHIKGTNVAQVKKAFKNHLDSSVLPEFASGKNQGKKSQLYGAIVTCGFPIAGREDDYVQIDNIIVTNENEQRFQREFLNLDAAKQGLIMGYIRTILHHKNADEILEYIGLVDLPKPGSNQEYEFVLSSAGLSFRLVTLNSDMRETGREELWRSANWDLVEYILSPLDLSKSYEELLDEVAKVVKNDNRSKRRIVGIMKSMIKVGPGEVGTPKGDGKIAAIERAEIMLKESVRMISLYDYLVENLVVESTTDGLKDAIEWLKATPLNLRDMDAQKEIHKKWLGYGRTGWFADASSMIQWIEDNWDLVKSQFCDKKRGELTDELKNKISDFINNAYDWKTVDWSSSPFAIKLTMNNGKLTEAEISIRKSFHRSSEVLKSVNEILGKTSRKFTLHNGFGGRTDGRWFEKTFADGMKKLVKDSNEVTNFDEKMQTVFNNLQKILGDEFNKIANIQSTGKQNSQRQIFSKNSPSKTFQFPDFDSLMKTSGEKLADVKFVDDRDNVLLNVSLKKENSQTSGPSLTKLLRNKFFQDWVNLGEYSGSNDKDADMPELSSFCAMLGISIDDFYKFYIGEDLELPLPQHYNEDVAKFIALLIGSGYLLVNEAGHIYKIPEYYNGWLKQFGDVKLLSISKTKKENAGLKSMYLKLVVAEQSITLIFRTSDGGPFPYRFIIQNDTSMDNIYKRLAGPGNFVE